jgi:hypothetical protein
VVSFTARERAPGSRWIGGWVDALVKRKVPRMNIIETESKGLKWIHLAHDRTQWWSLVNTVMKIWVP